MDYRELGFYQKAREVIKGINQEIIRWPKTMQAVEVAQQLFRASTSVGANIAEGHGRHEGREYIHYLIIAQASSNEVDHWLNTTLDCDIGNPQELHRLVALNNETRKMLASAIYSIKNNPSSKTVRETPDPYTPFPSTPEEPNL